MLPDSNFLSSVIIVFYSRGHYFLFKLIPTTTPGATDYIDKG